MEALKAQPAILFDLDGTLAETERDGHRVAFNRAFEESGLPWHWDERLYGALLQVTGGKERIASYAARHDPGWLARPDSSRRIADLHARKNALYAELVKRGAVALRPGAAQLLDEIELAGWRLGIVSTTSRANLDALLGATLGAGAIDRLALVVCGEDVERKKPDPQAYALALRRLQLAAGRAIAIEDSRNGLLAAHRAGIATLIVRSLYSADEDFSEARAVFDGFAGRHGDAALAGAHRALSLDALRRALA